MNRKIQILARYIGCKCDIDYASNVLQKNVEFSISKISDYSKGYIRKLTLHLKPISELTEEDFERMKKDLGGYSKDFTLQVATWITSGDFIEYEEADWLWSNGYYLGEPEIKEFVRS